MDFEVRVVLAHADQLPGAAVQMSQPEKPIVRRPRGQRMECLCANPKCGKTFSREKSALRDYGATYCSRDCMAACVDRVASSERRPSRRRTEKLTPWVDVSVLPLVSRVGLYRGQTQNMPPERYIDAWWEDGQWWLYDENRRQRHSSLSRLNGLVRWRGRIIPPYV